MLIQSALLALSATLAAAVQPLVAQGNAFVNPKTGNRFQIVGVAYQPGGSGGYNRESGRDPLSDKDICLRDAALMQVLGANAVRIYNLNPDVNHDECASIYNAAGIYLILDVNSPLVGESLTSFNVWESYYAEYLNRTFAIVEAFKNYPNTLAFFSGNEVIDKIETGKTVPPYIRAVTRDLRNYIKNHSTRPIPVGYSAADVREVLDDSYNYFECAIGGNANDMSRGELFALNSYSWCGNSSFEEASYDKLVATFEGDSIPVFLSEYGCNTPSPRIFTEVGAIYGPRMTGVFSGGIVYQYTQEENNFGLVNMSADFRSEVRLLGDFDALRAQFAQLNMTQVQGAKPASTTPKPPACASSLISDEYEFNNNFTLPVPPPGAPEMIEKGIRNKPVGKLVKITDFNVTLPVFNSDGGRVTNLAVKPLADDETNTPGTNTAAGDSVNGSGSATAPPPASSSNKDNAAPGFSARSAVLPAAIAGLFAVVAGLL